MNAVTKPKIDNNALFQQLLITNPPEYNIGDLVKTSIGIAYVSGRAFKESDKTWKYVIKPYGLNNFNMDDVIVYGKV
jgi:hypothetical protein